MFIDEAEAEQLLSCQITAKQQVDLHSSVGESHFCYFFHILDCFFINTFHHDKAVQQTRNQIHTGLVLLSYEKLKQVTQAAFNIRKLVLLFILSWYIEDGYHQLCSLYLFMKLRYIGMEIKKYNHFFKIIFLFYDSDDSLVKNNIFDFGLICKCSLVIGQKLPLYKDATQELAKPRIIGDLSNLAIGVCCMIPLDKALWIHILFQALNAILNFHEFKAFLQKLRIGKRKAKNYDFFFYFS